MYPVSPRTSADRHDQVIGVDGFLFHSHRDHSYVSRIDQGIPQITRIEIDRAVDGGDPHSVAVISDAGDDYEIVVRDAFTGDRTVAGVREALRRALRDPEVEVVFAGGLIATEVAASMSAEERRILTEATGELVEHLRARSSISRSYEV